MMEVKDTQTEEQVETTPAPLEEGQVSEGQEQGSEQSEVQTQDAPDKFETLTRELEAERRKSEFYQQMAIMNQAVQQRQQPVEETPSFDPTYVPNGADVQNYVDREIQRNVAPIRETQHNQMIRMQEELLRRDPDTADYDEVVKTYATDLFRQNPGLYEAFMARPNAPQLAYNLGRSHPDYQKKQKAKTSQDLANTINSNLRKPTSITSQGGKSASNGAPDYATMSKEDLDREIMKVKGLL
jgi:hypothetical protein